jgi:hypothetical protein
MGDDRAGGGTEVMEHREPLRIALADRRLEAAVESPREPGSSRARRLGLIGVARRVDPRRLALLSTAGLVIVLALGYLVSLGTLAAVAWLHRQPYYQLRFDKIRLDPGPPPWFRGGRDAFLEAVRRSGHVTKPINRLDFAPDELAGVFKNYPWVEDARVTYPPDGIAVHLRYRRPVAYVQISRGDQLIVDDKGTILAPADVDESKFARLRLTRITAHDLKPPADPTPGLSWKSEAEPNDVPRADRRVLAAAKLAGFLRDQEQSQTSQNLPALRIGEIIVTDFNDRGLFVLNDEGQTICWRQAPGEERPGEPKSAEKWDMLRKWGESSKKRSLPERDYWWFSQTELREVCTHAGRPHLTKPAPEDEGAQVNTERKAGRSG